MLRNISVIEIILLYMRIPYQIYNLNIIINNKYVIIYKSNKIIIFQEKA